MRRTSFRKRLMVAFAAAILVAALTGCGNGKSPSSPSGAHVTPDPAKGLRTIRVFDVEPAPSPSATDLQAGLEKGKLPNGSLKATVLSDEDCTPDKRGISHCKNDVRLANGQELVLRHPHDMNKVPCLAPGEKVLLRRA